MSLHHYISFPLTGKFEMKLFLSLWLLLQFLQARGGAKQQHCIGMAKLLSWLWSSSASVLLTASGIGHLPGL